MSGGRKKDKITMDKVFPEVQKLMANERCFTWYVFSFFSRVQVGLVQHFADASHLEKRGCRYHLKSTGEGSGSTSSGRMYPTPPKQDAGKQSSVSNCFPRIPAADLSLTTTASCPTSPPEGTKQKPLQEVPEGSNPDIMGQVMAPALCVRMASQKDCTKQN